MTGAQLKTLRYKLDLSLAQASKQVEVSPRTWCRWEAGESRIPATAVKVFKMVNGVKA
ncbi:MAG: helix-turn-helix domain-containing protein [Gallionella sp.]|nr:helix-turn-helix domain-containing protein [Gallionella sp.]